MEGQKDTKKGTKGIKEGKASRKEGWMDGRKEGWKEVNVRRSL